jgi:hypothetical protein
MELDFNTPFHPTYTPNIEPKILKPATLSVTTKGQEEEAEKRKQKSFSQETPITPTQTVDSRRLADQAFQYSLDATSKADQIQEGVKKSGVQAAQDIFSRDRIPNNISSDEIEKFITEDASKIKNASAIKPVAESLLEKAEAARKDLNQSANALQSTAYATPSLAVEKNGKSLVAHSNPFLAAVDDSLKAARHDQQLIKIHPDEGEKINTSVENLLALQQLTQRYAALNLDKVDLTKDGTTEEQRKDFQQMAELIQKAQGSGVLWKQPGWNSAKERDSYLKGVTEAAAALQSKNKINDIKLQQSFQNLAARLLFTTTMIKRHHDLITSIIHNMRNG